MESGGSKTALLVAAYRGRATRNTPHLCFDPWAQDLAGAEGLALTGVFDVAFPPGELWVALRTACLDGQVRRLCGADRIPQVVILGAGLDTRAARLGDGKLRFFEVDHPETQADKLRRLRALKGYPLEAATYVRCDFEKDDFLAQLAAAGFALDQPALFLWEGVMMYLTEPAVRSTFRKLASGCDPRTVVLFDFMTQRFVAGQVKDKGDKAALEHVAAVGEPFRFGTKDPLPLLYEEGFRHVRTVSFDDLALSFTGTYERARKFKLQHIALASRTVVDGL